MVLEWLRRHDAVIDKQLHTYLFTEAPVTEVEAIAEAADGAGSGPSDGSLGIGSLKGRS
jgi:hypothetical protein